MLVCFYVEYFFNIFVQTADMKIMASGAVPNSEPLQQFFATSLSPAGYVKVRDSLQLEGFGNIFAFGDIADLQHAKVRILNNNLT